jgi:hypothetical protein
MIAFVKRNAALKRKDAACFPHGAETISVKRRTAARLASVYSRIT